MKHFILSLLIIVSPILLFAENVPLKKGMIITHSAVITKATYNLNADTSLKQPLIIIEGKNITVDFNQCILQGSNDVDEPNKFYGLAILIKKGSENIVLKNANIHRFKVAVMADSVSKLNINNSNFSYNYRQHLHSNPEREDVSDWMSYHHNENNEWLRYGAGIYLKQCSNAVVKNNKITGGQCGLMMTRCESNEVYNNDFSFNSGIGIGMCRSNNNKIYHNSLDFNVRGFSFGKSSRGQDSAGILVFEQCNNNV
ncbi:MAG TPA: right-handed parallel beta-helix repeat-containing protein, partial [Chitinophagaceae bacterium]|nr:right-handed parallel beta-helix repeat-containing protein [Chitinophagaceae bacterium]